MVIQEMHYDFKIKNEKVDSNQKRNYNPAQIDWLLNEAQSVLIKQKYGINNKFQVGFETTEKRIQDLKNLHIKSPGLQDGLVPALLPNVSDTWELDLGRLTYNHLFTTRVRVDISKGSCVKKASVTITQTDDLNDALIDPHNSPNFNFGQVLGVYGKSLNNTANSLDNETSSLYIYTDGSFNIDNVYIDYIKHPNRMWLGTYDLTSDLRDKDSSNTYIYQLGVDSPVNCELSAHTHREIVDMAVYLASTLIEDPNLVQLSQAKLLMNN